MFQVSSDLRNAFFRGVIKAYWDGKVELLAEASPVLDAGGNVAISPSGRRVAVLDAGAIQIYTLPEPPPLQDGETKAGR